MRHALRLALTAFLTLVILTGGLWGALFVGHWMPGGAFTSWAGGLAVALFAVVAARALKHRRYPAVWAYGFALVGLGATFAAIPPRSDRDWAFDVAHPVTATFASDMVDLRDVRNFDWRSETEATARWETRTFDLTQVETLDLINSYWSGRTIAHTLLSFGFRDGRYLALSIEIRRERGEDYSNLAGFFKRYELITVAADERDIVKLRTNVRREDVEMYRIKAKQEQIRALLVEILKRANAVAASPAFYNSLGTNCTTALFGAARSVAPNLPFDWRIILSGYLPDYAYDRGLLDTRLSLDELSRRGAISERGKEADAAADFSARIREGIPDPNQ